MKFKADIHTVKNVFLVLLGTMLLAFGSAVFVIPFELVTGGMAGVAIVVDRLIGSELITVDLIIAVLSWGLFILGCFTLGRRFAVKTLISTAAYPVFVSLFLKLSSENVMGGYFYLLGADYRDIALILAAAVGGALVGVGSAIAFLGGGSTGGTDILAFVICKLFPRLKSPRVIFVIDALIVAAGMFVINDLVLSLMGIASAFVCAAVIDRVFLGGERALIAHIVSDKGEEIGSLIIERLSRSATLIEVKGAYSGMSKQMIMVSFTRSQYTELLKIINETDKSAFVTVHRAHGINGEGWTK